MSEYTSQASHRTISFGFLIIPLQAIDMVGPMDILIHISKEVVRNLLPHRPQNYYPFSIDGLVDACPSITFHHIGPTLEPIKTSGNCHIQPTVTMADCPDLDYLLVGGPNQEYFLNVPDDIKKFIVKKSKQVKTIFTTCTGGLVLAGTGLLDYIPATTNHTCITIGKKTYPNVEWTDDKHWVVVKPGDEMTKSSEKEPPCEIWTSAGAGAGMNMMAEWIKTEFGMELGSKLLGMATNLLEWRPCDIDGLPMEYVNGKGQIA